MRPSPGRFHRFVARAWRALVHLPRHAGLPLLALALALQACSRAETAKPSPQPSVSGNVVNFPEQKDPDGVRVVAVAAVGEREVALPGRLGWDEDKTTRVYAPYAGRVERLRVAVGQSVQRGQPLADVVSADIGQAQADVQKSEADAALARKTVERARELAAAGVIARKELDQAEADLARSSAENSRARARLQQYRVTADSVTQSLALAAPLAGVVVERNSNPGIEVRTDVQGPALFVISDPTSLWATIDVDETQLAGVQPGQAITLRSTAWPGELFEATVLSVGESVDPASRTVKVRARVPNPERKLKAEMFVTASVRLPGGLPAVPADAVFLRGDKSHLFVQKSPGRYERREVQVRSAGAQTAMVLRGVAAGESVVVGGGLYLNQLLDSAQ